MGGVDFLLAQEQEGRWPAVPILRIPSPTDPAPVEGQAWLENGLGTNVIVADQNGIFTAAAALWALTVARDVAA